MYVLTFRKENIESLKKKKLNWKENTEFKIFIDLYY